MSNETTKYFDLPRLLKQNDLNTRNFAETAEVSVDKYFLALSKFMELAPFVPAALRKFIDRNGDKDVYKTLNDMAALLKDIGCKKFISDIYSILDAYEKGNWRLAAHHAEMITDEFEHFYQPVIAAKRAAKPEDAQIGSLSLKEYISRFDEEEANRKLVILTVDDSPVILQSVSSVLSDTYKVYTLPKPAEIEKVLKKLTPDLFLLDYLMPEVNGLELISKIRNMEDHKDTPIIFLTSEGDIDTVTAALGLGACDFVVKPFRAEVLREKIARHIVRKKRYVNTAIE